MKKLLLLLSLQFIVLSAYAQPPFAWAKSFGNSGSDEYITGMKVDVNGYVYVTGFFSGTLDFDASAATHTLTSAGLTDIFVAKYSGSGVYQWAVRIGDTGYDEGDDLAIDDSSNIYVCGYYNGNPDFDPGSGTKYLGANTLDNAYYLKLSSSGAFLRAAAYSSSSFESAHAIAVDAAHNVYVTGICNPITIGSSSLGTHGGIDVFITKTNVAGVLQWAKDIGGSGDENVSGMDLDNAGNLFISGSFSGTDFDVNPTNASYIFSSGGANTNSFMLSMTTAGAFNWGNNWGQSLTNDTGEDIVADANGESFQAANFGSTIESIARRDNAGNGYWGVATTGATAISMQSLACDGSHSIYMAGYLAGSMSWNSNSLGSSGSTDIFVGKWTNQSVFQWQFVIGGVGGDAAYEVAIGPNNTVFVAGVFSGNVDFNPSMSATNYLTSVGGTDMFIMRLGSTITGMEENSLVANSFYAYPNPTSDELHVSFSKTGMQEGVIRLLSMDGKCVLTENISVNNEQTQTLDISSLSAGMYILDVQQENGHQQQKVLKR